MAYKGVVVIVVAAIIAVVVTHYSQHDFALSFPSDFDAANLRAILRARIYEAHRRGENFLKVSRSFEKDLKNVDFINEMAERKLKLVVEEASWPQYNHGDNEVIVTWHVA